MGKLTVKKVQRLNKPGNYADGGTLFLRVSKGGTKQWVQRLRVQGKPYDRGLGSVELVSLEEAREIAFDNRRIARRGGNPFTSSQATALTPTFAEAAAKAHAVKALRWKNPNHAAQWLRTLERYAFPVFGQSPVDLVTSRDVLNVLTPEFYDNTPETAKRVRSRIRSVFGWAVANGYRSDNPAGDAINEALPKATKQKGHFKALPYRDVPAALEAIADSPGVASRLLLQFGIFTATRPGEAREATWQEIDFEARTWTIPAERMKAKREHRVPLSDAAVAVLREAEGIRGTSDHVFPSPMKAGEALSNMAGSKLLTDLGLHNRATVHGFRSSFRDWCAETGKRRQDAEAALAHVVGGTEGAYFRSDLFDRRRVLMQQWADFATGKDGGKVVELRAA